jgi:hypothetical protein
VKPAGNRGRQKYSEELVENVDEKVKREKRNLRIRRK